jgi:MazG family protein
VRGDETPLEQLRELTRRLRAECPWDREQTHASLTRHLLEEAYEVLEALDHLDEETGAGFDHLEEELGDLLFQVVFHSVLAAEEGQFTLADVARGIHDKLRDRHPHVFDPQPGVNDTAYLTTEWERRKVAEKGRDSVMDGIPAALPALAYAAKVQKKAASQGVDWRSLEGVDPGSLEARLLALVDESRASGEDPETALRAAVDRLRDAFRAHH